MNNDNLHDPDSRHDLAVLMRQATRDVDVPVGRLAAGGLRRGRIARRRHRGGIGVAAVAVLGAVGLGYQVLPHSSGPATPSGATGPAAQPSTSAPAGPPGSDRRLAGAQAVLDGVLAALPAGTVTQPQIEGLHGDPSATGYQISLQLRGALVTFYVDDPNSMRRASGLSELGPGSECTGSQPMPAGCSELPDGSWQNNFSRRTGGVGVPASRTQNDAYYWSADGWRVYSAAYNATGEKTGTTTGAQPPLTNAELAAIAQSDVWFAPSGD